MLDYAVRYPQGFLPANASYPFGIPKNATTETSKDGSPWDVDQIKDWHGFFQGLADRANITPSGNADTATVSQYYEAVGKLFAGNGELSKSVAGSSNVTITDDEAINGVLRLTGAITADIDFIVPNTQKSWNVINDTTGSFTITVKTVAGTGITLQPHTVIALRSDGTNVVALDSSRVTQGFNTGGAVADAPNVIEGHSGNYIVEDVHSSTISGGGLPDRENVIGGIVANVNTGTSNVPSSPILGTISQFCLIGGGYDNVVNGLANVITAGQHCAIDVPADHGTIAGGSINSILDGSYNGIFGGTTNTIGVASGGLSLIAGGGNNVIDGAGSHVFIGAGSFCNANGASFSSIGGGLQNTLTGCTNSTISGGNGNTIDLDNSTISGGNDNTIAGTGQGCFIGAGISNSVAGENSFGTGRENETVFDYSMVSGYRAKATRDGERTRSDDFFTVVGDAKSSEIILKKTVTSASEVPLEDVTGGASFPIITNRLIGYKVTIIGHRTDVVGDNCMIILQGMAERPGAGSHTITTLADQTTATAGAATWTARMFDSAGSLRVGVTGEAAKTINWVAEVEWMETFN